MRAAAVAPVQRIKRACEVCGSSRSTLLKGYTTTSWPVVQCVDCRFVYLGSVPSYAKLVSKLAWEKTSAAETARRSRGRLAWIDSATHWRMRLGQWLDTRRRRRTLGVAGNVLDLGCGDRCRVPDGPTPYGIEISAALAKRAGRAFERRGGRVVQAPAVDGLDLFEDGFFSAILMRSFLEHERQPRLVLEKAYRRLAPGGTIYVRLPDYGCLNRRVMGKRWCGWRFPDHVNYFTSASLGTLARSIGFTYRRTNWLSVFDDNIIAVLTRPA